MSWRSTFVANALILCSGVASGVLAARALGVDERGLLAAVTYWPHFIVGMMSLGLSEAIVIQVAKGGYSPRLSATVTALSIGLAGVVVVVGVVSMPWLIGKDRQAYVDSASLYLCLLAPFNLLAMNLLAIEQGRMDFRTFNLQRILQAVLYPVLLAILWYVGWLSVASAAFSMLAGTVILGGVRAWLARAAMRSRPSLAQAKQLLNAGLRIHAVDVFGHLSAQVDKMALILFSTNSALGLYVTAQTLANAMQAVVTQTFAHLSLPLAAKHNELGTTVRALRGTVLALCLVSIALLLVLPGLISLLFGPNFAGATGIARVLTLAAILSGIKKALLYVLRARGSHRIALLAEAVSVTVMAVGILPAVRWRDAFGLAVLVVLAQGVSLAMIWRGFSRVTGVDMRMIFAWQTTDD